MGWCSGTEIFDAVAEPIIVMVDDPITKRRLLTALVEALEGNDWDCQSDSDFWNNKVVRGVFTKLHPDWEWNDVE